MTGRVHGWPAAALGVGLFAAACTIPQPSARLIEVTLYGRNAAPVMAWFAIEPTTEPQLSGGFGQELGYVCWKAPAGSRIVLIDRAPSDVHPARVVQELASVDDPAGTGAAVLWVDVGADRSVASGVGVPAWWPDNGGTC